MRIFKVKAATNEGKVVFKDVEATSAEEVKRKLDREGLYPLEVSSSKAGLFKLTRLLSRSSVKSGDFLVFNQGFISLLKAGVPVLESLETLLKRNFSEKINAALYDVIDKVKSGDSVSEAMGGHPEIFPELYVSTISAGEKTGDLVPALSSYVIYIKRMMAIRKKVVSAVTYPLILSALSIIVIGFLLFFVVPVFSKAFMGPGVEIPIPSRILLAISAFVRHYFALFVVLFILAAVAVRLYLSSDAGRRVFDSIKLRLPVFADIYKGYVVAKFSRTLSMVLGSGMSVIYALEMSRGVLNNAALEEKLDDVVKMAKEGASVTDALGKTGMFPPLSLSMFSVGERSANLPEVLGEIADFHDDDVEHKVGIITDLLEPVLMVVMGLLIGTIVVLLYLPIFQLGATVGG